MNIKRIRNLLGVSALVILMAGLSGCKEETNVSKLSTVDTVKGAENVSSEKVVD